VLGADELRPDGFEDNSRSECVTRRWHPPPLLRFPAGGDALVRSRGIATRAIFRDGTQDALCNCRYPLPGSSFFPLYGDEVFKVFTFCLEEVDGSLFYSSNRGVCGVVFSVHDPKGTALHVAAKLGLV